MDRDQEIGRHLVGLCNATHETWNCGSCSQQERGACIAGVVQLALDHLGEAQVEIVFGSAARRDRTRNFRCVTDIDDHAKLRSVALRYARSRGRRRALLRPRRRACHAEHQCAGRSHKDGAAKCHRELMESNSGPARSSVESSYGDRYCASKSVASCASIWPSNSSCQWEPTRSRGRSSAAAMRRRRWISSRSSAASVMRVPITKAICSSEKSSASPSFSPASR